MFGKKKVDPKEQAKAWKSDLRGQVRELNKQMRHIEMEETKIQNKVKTMMKQGHGDMVEPLVKELVQSKKAKSKILKTRTQLESIERQIDLQMAQVKVCGAFSKSAEVTHALNSLVRLPELNATMMKLQGEMQKAGMIEEQMDSTMEAVQEDDEDPELATRIAFNQIAQEINGQAGTTKVPLKQIDPEELEAEPEVAAMMAK
ncbi:SNF7 family protein [Trichomonas vaginalis G3]|uniref:SNF7 family protein n=1 Tax=Trichomonas vaginalis (strain ATCC PRA-98 / G3) TaxID=412133 RepID=A2ESD1_TRIV3|nr:vacuolar transport [Trichomonas vaginalis G3]EAY04434.1 SNF7 family protein [Trichomonas vaginalis G3]KAI5502204.1 vacuolar transport [Trichomonas vaginalis G3]|eukprot:XP_001316657.1 SNF7 family protein [Trichomonas vaginalis G3]